MWLIARSALLGVATGGRTMAGAAAVATGRFRPAALALAAGELIGDKFPEVGSRLAPVPLAGRLAVAGATAGTLARRAGRNPVAPVLVAATAAYVGAVLGARWRAYAHARHWAALPAAVAEDVVTYSLATTASRYG